MCAWETFDGKHGSMEPYREPSAHISSDVGSLNTIFISFRPSASKYVRQIGADE